MMCHEKQEETNENQEKDEYEEDLVAKSENEFFELIEKEKKKLEKEKASKEELEKQDGRKVIKIT